MLEVLTLNLNYYGAQHGAWPDRRTLICDVISTVSPDVVALQAVARDAEVAEGIDQAAQLASLLPDYRHVYFQAAAETPGGGAQGSATLSRLEPVEVGHLTLSLRPDSPDTSRRVLLHTAFIRPTGALHVFNAHFSWVEEQAADNLAEALPYISSFEGPALLIGDFNMTPDTPLLQRLRDAGWVDAWNELQPNDDGYTFESNRPNIRIDYAWANQALAPRVAEIELVARQRDDGTRLSDHLGLLVGLAEETSKRRFAAIHSLG